MSDQEQVMVNVEYADMLERKVKDLQSRLDKYQKLVEDMREWHAVIAYSDFEKHERAWEALIVRAAELNSKFVVEKQSTNVTAHVHRFEWDAAGKIGTCACGQRMYPSGMFV